VTVAESRRQLREQIQATLKAVQKDIDDSRLDDALYGLETASLQVRRLGILNAGELLMNRHVLKPGESWIP
jgi:hypothetical protein